MCADRDAELTAQNSPTERGRRLRVFAHVMYDAPLSPDDMTDAEIARLLQCYEITALGKIALGLIQPSVSGMPCS